jgi:hypothetical protein
MHPSDHDRPCGCPGDGDPHMADCPILTDRGDWYGDDE